MQIAVIGRGGHSKVVQDIIRGREDVSLKAVLDDKYSELIVENGLYAGPLSSAPALLERLRSLKFVVAVGDNETRKNIVARIGLSREHYIALIHRTAVVSPDADIGLGTVIMPNAVVNAGANVGDLVVASNKSVREVMETASELSGASRRTALSAKEVAAATEQLAIGAGSVASEAEKVGE